MQKTNSPGYVVNDQGVVINNDEQAWRKYQAEREMAMLVHSLKNTVEELQVRIAILERRLNETATDN